MQALQVHSRNIYENCEKAHMQCYVQARSHKLTMPPRPAVVIFPGGGYDYTSDREAEPVANAYLAAGYSAFVVRYAVGADARHPHPLLDAAADIIRFAECEGLDAHAESVRIRTREKPSESEKLSVGGEMSE